MFQGLIGKGQFTIIMQALEIINNHFFIKSIKEQFFLFFNKFVNTLDKVKKYYFFKKPKKIIIKILNE